MQISYKHHGNFIKLTHENKPIYLNKYMVVKMREIIEQREQRIVTEVSMFNGEVYEVNELIDDILKLLN